MSQRSCCVPGCRVTSEDGVPLHRFPDPDTDTIRFRTWVFNVGGDLTHFQNELFCRNQRVCHKHFESIHHYPRNRLCKLATPVLQMPVIQSAEATTAIEYSQSQSDSLVPLLGITPVVNSNEIMNKRRRVAVGPAGVSPRNKQFIGIIKKLKKCERDKISFKKKYILAKKISKINAFNMLSKNMSKATKIFCNMQITQSGKKNKGRRFTLDEKILALSLYKPSPKAYRLLSKICALPSRRTLQNVLNKIDVQPGINDIIFENLKRRVAKMPEKHRYCTLVFDEMAIGPSLTYSKKNDAIIGLVDNGEEKLKVLSDHVLVFMIRGILKKYKQPVAFSYCCGSTKTAELKKQIKKTIEKVQEAGLKVIATGCDQGASNVAALNQLLAETREVYLKNGQEYKGGFFEVKEKKIFPLYDPPHLIKGVRNNLLTKDLKYTIDEKHCTAKWSHIEDLYNRSPGYRGIKLVPKLTAHHVVPTLIPKMRVKHCTQVFSKSVGVAMGFMAECGSLPKESAETADLLIFFDELFDSVNASYSKIQNGKIYRTALTPNSPHHQLWNKSIPILKSMKFVGSNNQGVVPSLTSWVKTIEGFRLIFKHLNSDGISSLLLRNFNQDALENFFGAIRAHGFSNVMPTSSAFEAAYKTLLINNITSAHSVGANCEKDDSVCLQSLKYFFDSEDVQKDQMHERHDVNENHLMMGLVNTQELIEGQSRMLIERSAAIGYCSGWIAQLAKKHVFKNCTTCKNNLESEETLDFHKFIKVKEYSDKKWLCYPTRTLFDFFAHVEHITIEILKVQCNKNRVAEYIKLIIDVNLNLDFMTCLQHKEILKKYLIEKCVAFFINNWCKDVNNVLNGKVSFWDESDEMKNAANRHFIKNKGRKRRRQTNRLLNV